MYRSAVDHAELVFNGLTLCRGQRWIRFDGNLNTARLSLWSDVEHIALRQSGTQLRNVRNISGKGDKKGYLFTLGHVSLSLQRLDQFKQLIHQLLLGHLFDNLSLLEQQALAVSSCNTHICGGGLSGAVDRTAHNSHCNGLGNAF